MYEIRRSLIVAPDNSTRSTILRVAHDMGFTSMPAWPYWAWCAMNDGMTIRRLGYPNRND